MCRKKITTVSEFSPRAEGGPVRPREEKGVARFVGRRGLYTVRPRGRRGGIVISQGILICRRKISTLTITMFLKYFLKNIVVMVKYILNIELSNKHYVTYSKLYFYSH